MKKEGILICFTSDNGGGNGSGGSDSRTETPLLENEEYDEMSETVEEEQRRILIPMIGYASGNILLVGETRVSDSQLNDFETNIDFSSYIGPCIKCSPKGNAFFITNRFAISCKSLFQGSKEWSWRYSPLVLLNGNIPKADYVNFCGQKLSVDELLHGDEDLILLETAFFHHKNIIIPQIPPQQEGSQQWRYNCSVISQVSKEESIEYITLIYNNQKIKHFRGPNNEAHNEWKHEVIREFEHQLKHAYSNHGDVLVSFGITCMEWKEPFSERQDHLCTTAPCCKGSVVRFFSNSDHVDFEKDTNITQVCLQGNVSYVHGVHVGLSQSAYTNTCILTTSQKFIYLYCVAILKENTYFKEDGLLPFPTQKHAELALGFLEQALHLESIKYKVQNKLAQLVDLATQIIRVWLGKYPTSLN